MNYRRQFVRSIFIMHITFATPTEWGHQRYWVIITNAISEIVFLLSYYVGVAVSHRQRKQMHKHTHMRHNTYSTYTLGRHRTKKNDVYYTIKSDKYFLQTKLCEICVYMQCTECIFVFRLYTGIYWFVNVNVDFCWSLWTDKKTAQHITQHTKKKKITHIFRHAMHEST